MDNYPDKQEMSILTSEPAGEDLPVYGNSGGTANEPANNMSKEAWLKSLLFPGLSIVISLFSLFYVALEGMESRYLFFVVIFGLVLGGGVPAFMILWNRTDTSDYFVGKMVLFTVLMTVDGYLPVLLLFFQGIMGVMILLIGGVILIGLTVMLKTEESWHLAGKMLWLAAAVVGVILNLTGVIPMLFPVGSFRQFAVTAVIIALEIIFALVQKTDIKTKICLALSSLSYGYLGFLIGFAQYTAAFSV